MKRIAGILFLVAWLAAVTWYWRENVPLAPAKSITMPPNAHVSPVASQADEMSVMPNGVVRGPGGAMNRVGPVQIWSLPEARIVRTLLSERDQLVGELPSTHLLARRNGHLELIDVQTGQSVTTLPDRPFANNFRHFADRRQVLIQSGDDLELFDFDADAPRWTAKGTAIFTGRVGSDLILVHMGAPKYRPGQFDGVGFINIETGLPDPRFARMGKPSNIHTSRDGRLAMALFPKGERSMYDVETGRHLWAMPSMLPAYHYSFSPDGSEYLAYHGTRAEPRDSVRWRTSDGLELPKLSTEEMRARLLPKPLNGYHVKWKTLETYRRIRGWIASLNRVMSPTGTGISVRLPSVRYYVVDSTSGRTVGVLPDNVSSIVQFSKSGFTVRANEVLHYYSVPLRLDYAWLAGWAVIPPMLVMGLARLLRVLSRRRNRVALAASTTGGP